MFSTQKWRWSWPLAAVVASIIALFTIVHLFLFPLVPMGANFSLGQAQNSSILIDKSTELTDQNDRHYHPTPGLEHRFPADLHGAVDYHGAPWKARVGRWLSGCDSIAKTVKVAEVITNYLLYPFKE